MTWYTGAPLALFPLALEGNFPFVTPEKQCSIHTPVSDSSSPKQMASRSVHFPSCLQLILLYGTVLLHWIKTPHHLYPLTNGLALGLFPRSALLFLDRVSLRFPGWTSAHRESKLASNLSFLSAGIAGEPHMAG